MGSEKVKIITTANDRKQFMEHLLKDLRALEFMLDKNMFEKGIQRIGAEQELYLVDEHWRPAPVVMEFLPLINDQHFTTEYAKFNTELNLDPYQFTGKALSKMELDLKTKLYKAEKAAQKIDAHIVQVGILPTLRRQDLGGHNVTPLPRYNMLTQVLQDIRGGLFEVHLRGTDELHLNQAHSLYEASNTSFQVHFQVAPDEFATYYNWSQALLAPLMAITGNSPLLLGKRLWQETRIALFKQSIDIRTDAEHLRGDHPRVSFGNSWIQNSVLDIYKEDIVNYPPLLQTTQLEEPLELLAQGKIPKLRALSIHNGTVYRWNRACYGITNGKPHLRIENRIIPSGPTTVDQIANAAFWLGMMNGLPEKYKNIHQTTDFDYAKTNFIKAARYGLDTQFRWVELTKPISAQELILDELLPIAKAGLEKANIDPKDIEKYLGIIQERTETGKTGAKWQLRSFEKLKKEASPDEALVALTAGMHQRQRSGMPVHTWDLAYSSEAGNWLNRYKSVSQIMSSNIYTVNEKDSLSLVANVMSWKGVRHILVENETKQLVGVVSVKDILKWFTSAEAYKEVPSIYQIMTPNPKSITPDTSTLEALELINKQKIGCLPVVEGDKLLGIVTEHDFSKLSLHLMKELLDQEGMPMTDSLTANN